MKWIKLFEKWRYDITIKDELESFCKDNLAYLLITDCVFKLYGMDNSSSIEFLLYKPNGQSQNFWVFWY
jgi:hypothetical protein